MDSSNRPSASSATPRQSLSAAPEFKSATAFVESDFWKFGESLSLNRKRQRQNHSTAESQSNAEVSQRKNSALTLRLFATLR
jgi:hypothetical protein